MPRLILFLAVGILGMGRCAFAEVSPESQRYYALNALVTSLSRAQQAAHRLGRVDFGALSDDSATSIQVAVNDLLNAKERLFHLKRYAEMQNRRMKPGVEGLIQAYERLISRCLDLILAYHRMNPAASLEGLKGDIEKGWDSVFEACVAASHALVEYPFRDNHAFLVFNVPERDDLASEIDSLFPEAQRGFQLGQSQVLRAVCAIRNLFYEVPNRDERHHFKQKKFRYNLRRAQLRTSSRVSRQATLLSAR